MALFGWDNAVMDPATLLTPSSAATGYPAEMVRVPLGAPSVAWQTVSGVTSATFRITPPAPITWGALCLARTNLTPSATIRVRVTPYDSGTISAGVAVGIGQSLHILPPGITGASMFINIDDPGNPDRAINVPLIFAGPVQSFGLGPASDTGREIRRADTATRGGTVITEALSAGRQWQVAVPFLRDAQIAWLDTLEAMAAAGSNILFVPRESNARAPAETIFGLLTPARRGFLGPTGNFRTWSATMTERL